MAGEARIRMPPFIIFEGKLCSPDNIFISGEQELLIKIKGGAHRGADYFFIVVFCVLCGVSKSRFQPGDFASTSSRKTKFYSNPSNCGDHDFKDRICGRDHWRPFSNKRDHATATN